MKGGLHPCWCPSAPDAQPTIMFLPHLHEPWTHPLCGSCHVCSLSCLSSTLPLTLNRICSLFLLMCSFSNVQDWPYGRGTYISEDRRVSIWCNEEDHLRVTVLCPATTSLNEPFDLLNATLQVRKGIRLGPLGEEEGKGPIRHHLAQ